MTLEEEKQKLDEFLGKKVEFLITNPIYNNTVLTSYTLKETKINNHLGMVLCYFNETTENFCVNGEILNCQDENNKRKLIISE